MTRITPNSYPTNINFPAHTLKKRRRARGDRNSDGEFIPSWKARLSGCPPTLKTRIDQGDDRVQERIGSEEREREKGRREFEEAEEKAYAQFRTLLLAIQHSDPERAAALKALYSACVRVGWCVMFRFRRSGNRKGKGEDRQGCKVGKVYGKGGKRERDVRIGKGWKIYILPMPANEDLEDEGEIDVGKEWVRRMRGGEKFVKMGREKLAELREARFLAMQQESRVDRCENVEESIISSEVEKQREVTEEKEVDGTAVSASKRKFKISLKTGSAMESRGRKYQKRYENVEERVFSHEKNCQEDNFGKKRTDSTATNRTKRKFKSILLKTGSTMERERLECRKRKRVGYCETIKFESG